MMCDGIRDQFADTYNVLRFVENATAFTSFVRLQITKNNLCEKITKMTTGFLLFGNYDCRSLLCPWKPPCFNTACQQELTPNLSSGYKNRTAAKIAGSSELWEAVKKLRVAHVTGKIKVIVFQRP